MKFSYLQSDNFWDKVCRNSVYIAVFLLPLFFLSWTLDPLDFNKQFLLLFLAFIAVLAFSLKSFFAKYIDFDSNLFNLPVLIFLFIYGLSTIFSISVYKSFWGYSANISAGFLTLFLFVLLYFLIINTHREGKNLSWLLLFLIASGFIVAILNVLQLFGIFIFPWEFTKSIAFNTIGSTSSVAIFLVVLLPLIASLLAFSSKKIKWFLLSATFLFLLNLILINFRTAWLILALESIILILAVILWQDNAYTSQKNRALLWFGAILVISLVFVVVGFSLPSIIQLPPDVSLTYATGLSIAKESLLRFPALGTGPGTFIYDYALFKPQSINNTFFWDVNFEKGASSILDKIIGFGVLGTLSFFFMLWIFFRLAIRNLKEKFLRKTEQQRQNLFLGIGLFASFSGIFLAQFFYHTNFTLEMMFWVLAGGVVSQIGFEKRIVKIPDKKQDKKQKKIEDKNELPLVLLVILIFVLVFVLFLSAIPRYLAEIKYLKGLNYLEVNETELASNYLKEAIMLSPRTDAYQRDLSVVYLTQLWNILNSQELQEGSVEPLANSLISVIRNASEAAITIDSKNVINWSSKGMIYKSLIGVVAGVESNAIESYEKALELAPKNPYFFKELGEIYIAKAGNVTQESEKSVNLKLAKENLDKAVSLKNDFALAHFLLANVLLQEGDVQGAIAKLEDMTTWLPSDGDLALQLGIIYYNNDQTIEATRELERAIGLKENFLDAHYFLGLAYSKLDKNAEAILQFEIIEKFDMNNEIIKKIISNLKEGNSALDGLGDNASSGNDGLMLK